MNCECEQLKQEIANLRQVMRYDNDLIVDQADQLELLLDAATRLINNTRERTGILDPFPDLQNALEVIWPKKESKS